jgi:hypothetical protein
MADIQSLAMRIPYILKDLPVQEGSTLPTESGDESGILGRTET